MVVNIDVRDEGKLQAALDEVQKHCRRRVITVDDIFFDLAVIDDLLYGISDTAKHGTVIEVNHHGGKVATRCGWRPPMSTEYTAKYSRYTKRWKITSIYRTAAYVERCGIKVKLTEKARKTIDKKWFKEDTIRTWEHIKWSIADDEAQALYEQSLSNDDFIWRGL